MGILYIFYLATLSFAQESLIGPHVAAHQGGLYSLDFNTLYRFKKAALQGADIIEMDLRVTRDGIPVVFHDGKLDRWTRCNGRIKSKSWNQIKNCRYTLSGRHIVRFSQVLSELDPSVMLDAEFKDPDAIEPAIDEVRSKNAYDRVFFQTKSDPNRYYRARNYDPRVALSFKATSQERLDWALALNDEYLRVIELQGDMAARNNVDRIHAFNKAISFNAWALVPDFELLKAGCSRAFARGYDIAVSNNPKSCGKQKRNFQ